MNLQTNYMGLQLKNPLICSGSPLSDNVDNIKRMEDAGAGAVVMFSIFEEQLRMENEYIETALTTGTDSFAESLSYFPLASDFAVGPDRYLDLIHKAVESVDIPIIGSLNGITNEGWIKFAKHIQEAGAEALELNIFWIPTDMDMPGADVEKNYVDIVRNVKSAVTIPVAVKLSPFFSSIANMTRRLDDAGVDALVLFNRFYQPDFNLEEMEVETRLNLSTPDEIRLPLLWIAALYGKVRCSLAATRGVHSSAEIVKYLMAGADTVMTTSALLQRGIGHLSTMLRDLQFWMGEHEYTSVSEMRGAMSMKSVRDPTNFERANYIKMLEGYKRSMAQG